MRGIMRGLCGNYARNYTGNYAWFVWFRHHPNVKKQPIYAFYFIILYYVCIMHAYIYKKRLHSFLYIGSWQHCSLLDCNRIRFILSKERMLRTKTIQEKLKFEKFQLHCKRKKVKLFPKWNNMIAMFSKYLRSFFKEWTKSKNKESSKWDIL